MGTKPRRGRPPAPDRREAILKGALKCFVEKGFHGTTIPEIAKRAGVAAGTIYHYFDNKEALVNALYRKWKGAVSERVLAAFPPTASVREQFSVMWREMVAFAVAEPEAFAFIELHNHASYLDAESIATHESLRAFSATMVARAQNAAELKTLDPRIMMELVFGAYNSLMRAEYEGRIDLTPELIEQAEQACWDLVAAHPDRDETDP